MARGQKAWLLTWDWASPAAAVEDRLAIILRPRLSKRIVGEIVECLYAIHAYTPSEIVQWSKRPKQKPYKAKWHEGMCVCGHNPFLTAQYVHELVIDEDPKSGLETISYVVPPRYRYNDETRERELVREALPESFTRTVTGPLRAIER